MTIDAVRTILFADELWHVGFVHACGNLYDMQGKCVQSMGLVGGAVSYSVISGTGLS